MQPSQHASDKGYRVALVILGVGLAWRLALAILIVPAWESAARQGSFPDVYPWLAQTLLEDGVLGYGPHGANPTTLRGPGFPAWLVLGMLLGLREQAGIAVWSGVPGLIGGGVIACLVTARYGRIAGYVAGLIAVAHPLASFMTARVMSDEFYAVLGFLAVACFTVALSRTGRGAGLWALAAGLLLAAQMLTRANGLLTLLVIALVTLTTPRRRPYVLLLMTVTALAPVAAWSVRSSLLERRPVLVHSLAGYNFWRGEALHRLGSNRAPGQERRLAMELIAEKGDLERARSPRFWYVQLTPRESARMERRLLRAAALHVIEHPVDYLWRWSRGLVRFWIEADSPSRSRQYMLAVIPLLALASMGAVCSLKHGSDLLALLLVCVILLHNVVYAGIWPMARMSVQVYPALAYLSGVGCAWLVNRFSR